MGIKDLGSVFASTGALTALTGLTLDSNSLTSLTHLAGLMRLVSLSLSNNKFSEAGNAGTGITFAAPVSADTPRELSTSSSQKQALLPRLQTLQLAGCGLTSLVPLQLHCLPALRSLFIQGNKLSRLDGLEGVEQLRELVADRNRLR